MNLYIVRHGQTDWNLEHRVQGGSNISLNAEGIRQAKETATKLTGVEFAAYYSSPLARAMETAQIIAGGHEIIADARLKERGFGKAEGTVCTETELYPSVGWHDAFDLRLDLDSFGIERISSMFARTAEFLADLKKAGYKDDDNVLVVTHGGTAKALYANIVGYNLETNLDDMFWKNAEIKVIKIA